MLRKISYEQLVIEATDFSPNDTDADEINKVGSKEELTLQVGDVVIIDYATKCKMLSYMGLIQSVIENQYQV